MLIRDIEDREDLTLITDLQEVEGVKQFLRDEAGITNFDLDCVDGFCISTDEQGCLDISGFNGCVPDLYKELYRLL